jgi:undecaprenyl-diphosphatase
VSSTGHLTIANGLLGLKVDDPGVTAFTAIIQVGAILAVIIYFRSDNVWPALGSAASLTARPAKRPTTGSLGMSSSARYRLGSWAF